MYKISDDIVRVEVTQSIHLSLDEAKQVVEAINGLTNRIRRLILFVVGPESTIDADFVQHISRENTLAFRALALITGDRSLLHFTLKSSPPLKFFNDETEAIAWLNTQKNLPAFTVSDPDTLNAIREEDAKIVSELHHLLFSLYLRSDGILVRINADHAWYTMREAKESVAAIKEISGGIPRKLLTISGKKTSVDKDAKSYGLSDEAMEYVLAVAAVVKSYSQKLIGNLILSFDKPSKSFKLFDNTSDAIEWLLTLKLKNSSDE